MVDTFTILCLRNLFQKLLLFFFFCKALILTKNVLDSAVVPLIVLLYRRHYNVSSARLDSTCNILHISTVNDVIHTLSHHTKRVKHAPISPGRPGSPAKPFGPRTSRLGSPFAPFMPGKPGSPSSPIDPRSPGIPGKPEMPSSPGGPGRPSWETNMLSPCLSPPDYSEQDTANYS